MAAQQKFSDAQLLQEVRGSVNVVVQGPSVRACARTFGVAYQSMSERIHRLAKKGLIEFDSNGVRLTQAGKDYLNVIDRVSDSE